MLKGLIASEKTAERVSGSVCTSDALLGGVVDTTAGIVVSVSGGSVVMQAGALTGDSLPVALTAETV